jgi:hypothetical protein
MINNIPYIECYVRDAFLYSDFENKDLSPAYAFSIKTLINKPLTFQVQLSNGAIFQNLPIHSLVWKENYEKPCEDESELLSLLQWWNMQGNYSEVLKYTYLDGYRVDCKSRDGIYRSGKYLFTVDDFNADSNKIGVGYANDTDSKSFNIIKLDCGFFGAFPNNYLRFHNLNFVDAYDKENPPKYKPNTFEWDCEYIKKE